MIFCRSVKDYTELYQLFNQKLGSDGYKSQRLSSWAPNLRTLVLFPVLPDYCLVQYIDIAMYCIGSTHNTSIVTSPRLQYVHNTLPHAHNTIAIIVNTT